MSLQVFSARLGCKDPDVLDVTRQNGTDGLFLAPSWAILKPVLNARDRVRQLDEQLAAELMRNNASMCARIEKDMAYTNRSAWETYVPAYLDEMRRSYVANRSQWQALLARPRVVLVCFCTDPLHCHRWILRSEILPKLDATNCGELPRREALS